MRQTLHLGASTGTPEEPYFDAAEKVQKSRQSISNLYSIQGFHYCDLLLELGQTKKVKTRAINATKYGKEFYHLVSFALDQLTLGKAWLQEKNVCQADSWLSKAVNGLRMSRDVQYLPLGLLARAALHRHTHDFARAQQDLQEVFDIADGSGMRLFLTDYHLEMARLLGAEEKEGVCNTPLQGTADVGAYCIRPLQYHIAEAARLIAATGYHRRDKELLELRAALT